MLERWMDGLRGSRAGGDGRVRPVIDCSEKENATTPGGAVAACLDAAPLRGIRRRRAAKTPTAGGGLLLACGLLVAAPALAQPGGAQSAGGQATGGQATGGQATAQTGGTSPAAADAEPDAQGMTTEADLDDARARQHFTAGSTLYDAGRFGLAAEEFLEAHRLSGRPQLLYNIYVAHRDAHQLVQAAAALRQYLEESPPALADRVNLEARLRSLDEAIAAGGQAAAPAGDGDVSRPAAGGVSSPPDPSGGGPSGGANDGLEGPGAVPTGGMGEGQAEFADEGGIPTSSIVVGAVGLAALAAGAITGVLASGAVADLEDACPDDVCPSDFDLEGERSDARTLVRTTDFLLLGGGLLVATAVVLALVGDGSDDPETLPVAAACSTDGCAGRLQLRF